MSEVPDEERWNHNIAFHPDLLALVPPGAGRVLDAGCGDGVLTRKLGRVARTAVGMDLDAPSLARAAAETAAATVEPSSADGPSPPSVSYVRGDLLAPPFAPASFDVVLSVAALHHVDTAAGLAALAALVAPGGRLGIVGLARTQLPRDLPWEAASAVMTRVRQRGHTHWESDAPVVWPPPDTYDEVRRTAAQVLPGNEFRRRLLWRYVLTWTRPPDA